MGSGTLCKTFMGGSLANYCLLFFQPRAKFACQILFGIQAVRCTNNTLKAIFTVFSDRQLYTTVDLTSKTY